MMNPGDLVTAKSSVTTRYDVSTERLVECEVDTLLFIPPEDEKGVFLYCGRDLKPGEQVVFLEHNVRDEPTMAKVLTSFGVFWCDINDLEETP